ncbi:hypothetical protein JCM3770_004122 [Rhodotorula araucariae]
MASPVTTGRQAPVSRDRKDKTTLLNAGRLMSRRADREVEALKGTIAALEEERALARVGREAQDLAAAMRRTDGGIAIKVLQKEVSDLRDKVATLEQERDAALDARDALANSAAAAPPSSVQSGDLDAAQRQCVMLSSKVAELEKRLVQAEASGANSGVSREEADKLEGELYSARHEVQVLNEDKSKLAAHFKLARAQQKQAEVDAAREATQLNDRLAAASKRIKALEADLARARTAASAVKADREEAAALLQQKHELCEICLKERQRAHAGELATKEWQMELMETTHAQCESRWAKAIDASQAEADEAKEKAQQLAGQPEEQKKKGKAASPAEVRASSERILAQSQELKRLNAQVSTLKLDEIAHLERIARDRVALEKMADELQAACAAQRSAEDIALLLNERIARLERAPERQEGKIHAQKLKAEGHERALFELGEQEKELLPAGERIDECGDDKELDHRLLVAKLERKVAGLQAEKALAHDEGQARIAALEAVLATAGDVSPAAQGGYGLDEDAATASTTMLLDVCTILDGFKRTADHIVTGLATLREDAASMETQLRKSASKGRVRLAKLS